MAEQTILLSRFQFCHVENHNTGVVALHEGPKRLQLESHEALVGKVEDKIRVYEGQFVVVFNPFDSAENDIVEGEREVRAGPCVFPLHPGEYLAKDGVRKEYILTDSQALLLRAWKDAPHPERPTETITAGTEVLLKGPRKFIPHKNIEVKQERASISLAQGEGVYVQNDDTGEVRLIAGPSDFFLEHNESRWDKHLTDEENQALGFVEQTTDTGSRVLVTEPRPRGQKSDAIVIDLEDNQTIYIYDNDSFRVEFGPKTVFFGPHERPKVLFISGGVPVRPNSLHIAALGLGPDFIRDRLTVRTRDNATLSLDVTFRWRFIIDRDHPEKLFSLKDFVGFVAQTLSSEIREEAAQHTFEKFHSEAATLVKKAIFRQSDNRVFSENGCEVFGVDVEGITPDDDEIKRKLSDAIKTNVDIYTRRVQEEAQLESERRLIEGRAKNEEARKTLIVLQSENERAIALAAAETHAQASVRKAQGEADALTIKKTAEREAEERALKSVTAILADEGGSAYIKLEQARFGAGAEKVFVVPTDSRVHIGVDRAEE